MLNMTNSFRSRGFDLILKEDPKDFDMALDPFWFRRLLQNIVENAMKYSSNAQRIPEIIIHSESRQIQICDFGEGMAQEELGKVLESFYRIVGKYSSHSPSRASEDADGFGWW